MFKINIINNNQLIIYKKVNKIKEKKSPVLKKLIIIYLANDEI